MEQHNVSNQLMKHSYYYIVLLLCLFHCELKFYWDLGTEVTSPVEDVCVSSLVFQSQQLLFAING